MSSGFLDDRKVLFFRLQPEWAKPPSTPSADGVKPTKKPATTATQRPKPKPKPTPPKVTTHRPTKPPKKPTTEEPTTESSAVEEIQSTSEKPEPTSQKPKPSKPIVKPPLQPEVTDGCPCDNENEVETTTAKKPTTSRRPATTTGPTTTTSQGEEAEEEVVAEEGDLDTASSQDVDCTTDGFKSHQMCNKVSRQ